MGTLVRAHCDCSFRCELITGLTRDGMYDPSYCPTCNTFVSRAQFDCVPQAMYRCPDCGGPATPVALNAVGCPWCKREGLFFRPIRVVV